MWIPWDKVTEDERNKIVEVADKYGVSRREVANMFQQGMNFAEIEKKNMEDKIKKAIEILKVNKVISSSQTEFCECADLAIQALEKQIELRKYIDECKSCGRGSAVEFWEKYLVC